MSSAVPSAGQGLMDHNAGIGQGLAFAGGAGGQQHRAHRGRLTDAVRRHGTIDELHRVVNGQARRDVSARRIDVHVNVGLRVFRLQEEQLGDDRVGHVVGHLRAEKDDAVFQQATVNVHRPLFTAALLDDKRYQGHGEGVGLGIKGFGDLEIWGFGDLEIWRFTTSH